MAASTPAAGAAPALTAEAVRAQLRVAIAHGALMLQRLDGELAGLPWLTRASVVSRVPRLYLFLALSLATFSFLFLGFGMHLLSQLVGVLYPVWASMKSIEAQHASGGSAPHREEAQWLSYWVVFAVFSLLETFSDVLLFWLPFYYTLKVAFLLYCQLPMFRGAEFLYAQFVRPAFIRNQQLIDEQFQRLSGASAAIRNVIGFDVLARSADGPEAGGSGGGGAGTGLPGSGAAAAAPVDVSEIFGAGAPPGSGVGGSSAGGEGGKRRD